MRFRHSRASQVAAYFFVFALLLAATPRWAAAQPGCPILDEGTDGSCTTVDLTSNLDPLLTTLGNRLQRKTSCLDPFAEYWLHDEHFRNSGVELSPLGACARANGQPLTRAALCSAARAACQRLYSNDTCGETSAYQQLQRFADPDLRRRAFAMVRERFERFVSDPQVQSSCCGTGDSCETRACLAQFGQLRLRVFRVNQLSSSFLATAKKVNHGNDYDVENMIHTARHMDASLDTSAQPPRVDPQYIGFTEAFVLSADHVQAIEGYLYHEAGHACMHSVEMADALCRLPHGPSETPSLTAANFNTVMGQVHGVMTTSNCSTTEPNFRLMQRKLGAARASCLRAGFAAVAANPNRKNAWGQPLGQVCLGDWLEESFANQIFAPQLRGLGQYASNLCAPATELPDSTHGPATVDVECLLRDPAVQSRLCGGSQ